MINPHSQLDQLKRTLLIKGLSEEEASRLVDIASDEISQALIDLAFDVMGSVQESGIASKSADFVADLMLDISPIDISIRTQSGRSDFSTPPFPMMERLLKNAKTAKDGSRYKVIPLKEKSVSPDGLLEAHQALNVVNNAKREALKDQALRGHSLPTVSSGTTAAAAAFFNHKHSQTAAVTKFKTVSSKQNPATQWVRPGKDLDFSKEIHDANSDIQHAARDIIDDIISRYEGVI